MDFFSILLSLLCFWVSFLLVTLGRSNSKTKGKLPPGPVSFPVVGDLFRIGKEPHKALAKLAHTYGPLMSIKLGRISTVVVSSSAVAKEVLQSNDLTCSGRLFPDAVRALDHYKHSIFWLPVKPLWRNLRLICNTNLFNNKKLDVTGHLRRQKVVELVGFVRRCGQAGVAVDIGQAVLITSLNLLSNTFFSTDLATLGSQGAQEFRDLIWAITDEVGKPNIADYIPALRLIDPQRRRRGFARHVSKMFGILDKFITERLQSRREEGQGDVLDELLGITAEKKDENGMDRSHIKPLISDLFVAGTDTTSTTIEWAMTELIHNPSIMSKAREEIQRCTVGEEKAIDESDLPQLPYLQAIIKETLRLHPAAPLLVPHKAEEDVEICGYTVPKDTQILVNAWAIGRDPGIWASPDEFSPERFLGSDVDVRGRHFELIPFGAGRRICPGLPLALRMVHLVLASLIQSFDWKLEGGMSPQDIDMNDVFRIVLRKDQPLRAIPMSL